jgi:hypothetical protein
MRGLPCRRREKLVAWDAWATLQKEREAGACRAVRSLSCCTSFSLLLQGSPRIQGVGYPAEGERSARTVFSGVV